MAALPSMERARPDQVELVDRAQMHGLRGSASSPPAPQPQKGGPRSSLCRHSAEFFTLHNLRESQFGWVQAEWRRSWETSNVRCSDHRALARCPR